MLILISYFYDMILLLNDDSTVAPLSQATPGILALQKFDWLIDMSNYKCITDRSI